MNEEQLQNLTRKAIADRFGDSDTIVCRVPQKVPQSSDREYERILNAYMGLLKTGLEKEIPTIREEYKKAREAQETENTRNDSADDVLWNALTVVFNRIQNYLTSSTEGYGLRHHMESLANLTRKLTVKEWQNAVHKTLGIDILEDYYMGDFFQENLDDWVGTNVDLISTIPFDSLGDMKDIVYNDYLNGASTRDIVKDIRKEYDVTMSRAKFIARDQMAKLNADITQAQQTDAGVEEYEWSDSGDGRVRPYHAKLNGTRHRWDDPPEIYEWRGSMARGYWYDTGRKCHPGEDYQCRCVALPVFDKNKLTLPVALSTDGSAGFTMMNF